MKSGAMVISWAVAALVLAGCGQGADSGAPSVRDSAGVEIVTNRPGSVEAAEAWSLSSEPVVEIGAGADPDVALSQVTDVVPLPDGRVAVGTNMPPRALVFEADGSLSTAVGREGEGPGEFSWVASVVELPGDSLAVWDSSRRRISVFTADGALARELDLSDTAPASARAVPDDRVTAGVTHLLPAGSGAMIVWGEGMFGPRPAEATVLRPELPAHRIGPDGEVLATYGPLPGMTILAGGQVGMLPLPFGARTYATTSDGDLVVGTAESTELRVYGPDGALVRVVRWPDRERAVRGDLLARWSEMLDAIPEGLREDVRSMPRPERVPAYEGLVSTDGGEILVGDYSGPLGLLSLRRTDFGPEAFRPERRMPTRRWLVFDGDGTLTARLETPEGFEPCAVRDGRVWGVFSDELDVESVRAYGLLRG